MKLNRWQFCGVLALALLVHNGLGAIPSGTLQINVTDSTNHIWDASNIGELQVLSFDISAESTEISFAAPFIQTGAGKLIGAGPTQLDVAAPIFTGTIDADYKAAGSITGSKGIAKINFTGTAKGPAEIEGKTRVLAAAFATKVTVNSIQELASGVYASAGSASGYGAIKEVGQLDFSWNDVLGSMGNGIWNLSLQLTNDAVKKVGGTARVTLSSGAEFDLTVKGAYKSKTDTTALVLSGSGDSKGSALKVNLTNSTITAIQGKVSGQTVKWKL